MNTIKDGWKTSEFWSHLITQAGTVWALVGGFIPPKYAALIVITAQAGYQVSRLVIKAVNDWKMARIATAEASTVVTPTVEVDTKVTP